MSAVITTATPFVIEQVLFNALEALEYEPICITQENIQKQSHQGILELGDILTNRTDYYGPQHFRFINNQWILRHDSSQMNGRLILSTKSGKQYKPVQDFILELDVEYHKQYHKHLEHLAELEKQRLEEERKARVEEARKNVIQKAKEQGYTVKERNINNNIQLQLVRVRPS